MQDYNTIIGVIQMRQNECSYSVVQSRYHIGSSTLQLIMKRFRDSRLSLEQLKLMEPKKVEEIFYPPENLQRKEVSLPDFQSYYDRIHLKGSKVNLSYCWIEYKKENPDGYGQSQFYEYYNRFVEDKYGGRDSKMAVGRIPGERMYIDWVGDQPELLVDPETGEASKVHIFATTLGLSSLIYAEIFLNEKTPNFVAGTVHALEFYGGVTKYLVPDNLKAAIKKHTRDELILQTSFSDLEDFYDTIVLPPPPGKPKGKPTVEGHVKYLETHLVEKLKENIYTSLEDLNDAAKKIVAALNSRPFQGKTFSRRDAYEKYDRPCMKPLPGGYFTVCDYKPVLHIPDNYLLQYDCAFYSVPVRYVGKKVTVKATNELIRIYYHEKPIAEHRRAVRKWQKSTLQGHIPGKGVDLHGAYSADELISWAEKFGPFTVRWVKAELGRFEFEVQSYRPVTSVLRVLNRYTPEAAERASEAALAASVFTVKGYKSILSAQSRLHPTKEKRVNLNDVFCAHEEKEGSGYGNS